MIPHVQETLTTLKLIFAHILALWRSARIYTQCEFPLQTTHRVHHCFHLRLGYISELWMTITS